MGKIEFGRIGVDVEGYLPDSLRKLFEENGVDRFIANSGFLRKDNAYKEGRYLQSECNGPLRQSTTLNVLSGYICYTTDIETYLLLLRTALLDITAANALVNEMYYQGLITPRRVI